MSWAVETIPAEAYIAGPFCRFAFRHRPCLGALYPTAWFGTVADRPSSCVSDMPSGRRFRSWMKLS